MDYMNKRNISSGTLVSIIVPVYNVENYLSRGIDSLLCQTYSNIEIILVNDGSTDNSRNICEKYQNADSRVRLISQKNKGLSGARNTGIAQANGEYIMFMDSDDYVAEDIVELLLKEIGESTFSMCFPYIVNEGKNAENSGAEFKPTEIISRKDFFKRALKDEYWFSACAKLYKKSLFEKAMFPNGKIHEDIFFFCSIFNEIENVAVVNSYKYFYFIRKSSITTSPFKMQNMDLIEATDKLCKKITVQYDDLSDQAVIRMCHARLAAAKKIVILQNYDGYKEILDQFRSEIKKNLKIMILSKKVSSIERIASFVFFLGNKPYEMAVKAIEMKNREKLNNDT